MIDWDYERASKSAAIFNAVIPTLESYFNGKIYSTEDHENQFAKLLDFKCAIDAIVDTNDAVFGIAHRVKYNYYEDFTIRIHNISGKCTEIDHMRQSGFKPRYHVQTIWLNNKPAVIAIAKTADLIYAIDQYMYTTKTAFSGDKFAILDWNTLIKNGINVDIIRL